MEFHNIELEQSLILIINNQKVKITLSLTNEAGNIKFGIDAPFDMSVNREEFYQKKQKQRETVDLIHTDFSMKVQVLFTALLSVTNKSEKLEVAAKQLFKKDRILTPKNIYGRTGASNAIPQVEITARKRYSFRAQCID